jgi:predicted component of type VI protein secretion system
MPITLSVQTYRAVPPDVPMSACFHAEGGTIGRTPGNGLVLDDPGRYISRNHARIDYQNGGYALVDTGSNPSLVNGRPLGKGRQAVLAHGDQLAIGEYLLEVSISSEPGGESGAASSGVAALELTMPFTPAAPAAAESHVAGGAIDPVYSALLRGLGLPDLSPDSTPAEVAEQVGAMLREATEGTIGLLLARTLIKRESQLPVTMLAGLNNNPLKFFPNADSALQQMLGPRKAGYMAPQAAFINAFDDMRMHWQAMMSGMRTALDQVNRHFDPARIAQALEEPSVVDKMVQANRKAKLWDQFVATYQQAVSDSDDEFQRRFGEEFSIAYEAQLERLQQAHPDHNIV